MRARLRLSLVLLVLLPAAAVTWLGVRLADRESARLRDEQRQHVEARVAVLTERVDLMLQRTAAALLQALPSETIEAWSLRRVIENNGLVQQIFVLDQRGRLLFPTLDRDDLSVQERDFIARMGPLWEARTFVGTSEEQTGESQSGPISRWYPFYQGGGLQLVYVTHTTSEQYIGVELNEMRLISELLEELCRTKPAGGKMSTYPLIDPCRELDLELRGAHGEIIAVWGETFPQDSAVEQVHAALPYPFGSFRLSAALPQTADALGPAVAFNLAAAGALFGVAILALGGYIYREHTLAIREAAQRVSFVNQVSHELKTPLTNIRLYAELLAERLCDEEETVRSHLQIIVSESQRLSRLISNVLSFSRKERQTLTLHHAPYRVYEIIDEIVEQFRLSASAAAIDLRVEHRDCGAALCDRDAVQQIMANVISNAEKYAGSGGFISILQERSGDDVLITVRDSGPGVPASERERIFLPFCRVGRPLNDAATGTGIGLSISRELARLHGGDLMLLDHQQGAAFQIRLNAPIPC